MITSGRKQSRLVPLLLLILVTTAAAHETASTPSGINAVNFSILRHRVLQQVGENGFITMCIRSRNGLYGQQSVQPSRVQDVVFQGGGYVGERVPYLREFVFGDDCQPRLRACADDVRTCPDGARVERDPSSNCAFQECMIIAPPLPLTPPVFDCASCPCGWDDGCKYLQSFLIALLTWLTMHPGASRKMNDHAKATYVPAIPRTRSAHQGALAGVARMES